MPAADTPPSAGCPNCGAPFVPERRPYCPECGQETQIRAPRIGEFIQQFGGAYLSTEGALWRTLKLLLLKPGELTRQYLAGRRRHYVLPLRLYLSISIVVLLVLRAVGGIEVVRGLDAASRWASDTRNPAPTLMVRAAPLALGLREGRFVCEGMPERVCGLMRERAVTDLPNFVHRMTLANQRVVDHFGGVMFVLLPLFAALLRLVYLRRPLRYTEHLVFALHVHAFWFLVLLGVPFGGGPGGIVGTLLVLGYTGWAAQRVYGGPWWGTLARGLVVTALYAAAFVVALAAGWLMALIA